MGRWADDHRIQYLLEQVVGIPNLVNLKSDASQENSLFHVFLFLFPHYLKAAVRKGIFKQYTSQAYNDKKIKGVVDVPRHLNQNTPFYGKVACNQREFSYDNNLMELVRYTLEFYQRMYINGNPLKGSFKRNHAPGNAERTVDYLSIKRTILNST